MVARSDDPPIDPSYYVEDCWILDNNHLPDNFVILWGQEGSYMVIKHHWGHNLYGLPSTPGRPPVLLWVHSGLEMWLTEKKLRSAIK